MIKTLRTLLAGAASVAAFATAAPAASADIPYISYGDSYASGYGLPAFDYYCQRSYQNYPNQLKDLRSTTLWDYSCAGAFTGSGDKNLDTQVGWSTSEGRLGATTSLVTVTIGGNDLFNGKGYSLYSAFKECASSSLTCVSTSGVPAASNYPVAGDFTAQAFSAKVKATLQTIRTKAPTAAIVIVGYPAVLPASGVCATLAGYTTQEVTYVDGLFQAMNTAMSQAVNGIPGNASYVPFKNSASGIGGKVGYADTYAASRADLALTPPVRHDACNPTAAQQWVSPSSFHPTATGQTGFAVKANSVVNAL